MGRTSLLMVLGFNIIFAIVGYTISNVASWAYQNYVDYYNRSVAREIAGSAANMGATNITITPNWRVGYPKTNFNGGTFYDSCISTAADSGRVRLCVVATYDGISYTDTVLLGLTKFSKFAYFSNVEGGINWATGDTVWGPFHSQDQLTVNGSPVFEGRTTSLLGYVKSPSSSTPQFLGGYESGVNIPLPANFNNMDSIAQAGGIWLHGTKDVYITLYGNAKAVLRYKAWTVAPFMIVKIDSFPFTLHQVIAVDSCNVHLRGVLRGQLTIACTQKTGSSTKAGNFWLDSSVVCFSDPLQVDTSKDMLGLVCDNGLWIKDTAYQNIPANGFTIQASMLSRTMGFGAENYNTRPIAGQINMLGGVQQYQRQAVGTLGGSPAHIVTGFGKNYRYDNRLLLVSPPFYPTTGTYEVLSWYE
jgi:hypothetical protein